MKKKASTSHPNTQKSGSEKTDESKIESSIEKNEFPIVGIGASAGGLEALELFFQNMPIENGMTFVIIQHLDPKHKGIMPELLQRITKMKVFQAVDRLKVKPNCLYVIPPNKSMTLFNGELLLFDFLEPKGLRLPIDTFFSSLADDQAEGSIGIILSGMGSDGSQGIKDIKEKNGIVLVQEPETAKFDGMPQSACKAVNVDAIAPVEQLPSKLIDLLKFIPKGNPDHEIEHKTKGSLEKIILLLRQQTGHDFSLYKKNTLSRRIERRKGIHQIDKIKNYVRFLQENPAELEILFNELLIGVTNFFRDKAVWDSLQESILPDLVNKFPDGYTMRAWVSGCSTGEEAYSLAIIFKEVMEDLKNKKQISLQIFATDLDKDAIDKARKGFYPLNITNNVSKERLSRYFTMEDDGFKINNIIREMVVFAPQNVIKDPPFTKLDLITCRNLLIYLEPELQNKLLALFNYSLNDGGIMVLGTSETTGKQSDSFVDIDNKLKIFQRGLTNRSPDRIDFPSSFHYSKTLTLEQQIPIKLPDNIQTTTDQILLQQYSPPSVLVNDNGDIIYITGRTGKYLEPAAGKANWNIHAMAREGLRQKLPEAFRKTLQSSDPILLRELKIEASINTYVDITFQRMDKPEHIRGMVLIVFNDVTNITQPDSSKKPKAKSTGRQKELELELQSAYEEMQNTREEMQTSQEELKSINEELQSTNEELQSTNEELTTSKEEMQSLNEELQTVNIELQSKVNDYLQVNDDMKNLLNSTEIATLFLDRELNIRRYTEQATKIIKLREGDIGRPFTDLVSNLKYPKMDAHAREVMKTLTSIETAITTIENNWYNVRIMPYRTVDDRIDGLVITFTDITLSKKLEIELKLANEKLLNMKKS